MKTIFKRLVRFEDEEGTIRFGEAPEDIDALLGKSVSIYEGDQPWELIQGNEQAEISRLLNPLPSAPIIYGIGLNYKTHLSETGFPTPKYPVYFSKPPDALAGPFEDISIPKYVRDLDYEGELYFVIGRDCKYLDPSHEPSDYILGFMVGNDVSAREWQTQETAGGQHHVAKSFDKFALMGPFLTSYSALRNPENLKLETRVNNEVRQQGHTSDLLFSIKDIMVHLSRGKTLRRGTVVMTGTPSGVAAFMDPKAWIKNGDLVEVTIEGLGTLRNKHVFV